MNLLGILNPHFHNVNLLYKNFSPQKVVNANFYYIFLSISSFFQAFVKPQPYCGFTPLLSARIPALKFDKPAPLHTL